MGKLVGDRAVAFINDHTGPLKDVNTQFYEKQFENYLNNTGDESIGQLRTILRSVMTEKASVFRTEESLATAEETLREIKENVKRAPLSGKHLRMNQELIQRWELDNLLTIAESICKAALYRKESRGAHFRDDYPERHDEFNHHTLVAMGETGRYQLGKREIDMSIFKSGGEYKEKFDFIERKY
jgi:succinate dehydrogenase / fumarate reductase flavoprotein subunit